MAENEEARLAGDSVPEQGERGDHKETDEEEVQDSAKEQPQALETVQEMESYEGQSNEQLIPETDSVRDRDDSQEEKEMEGPSESEDGERIVNEQHTPEENEEENEEPSTCLENHGGVKIPRDEEEEEEKRKEDKLESEELKEEKKEEEEEEEEEESEGEEEDEEETAMEDNLVREKSKTEGESSASRASSDLASTRAKREERMRRLRELHLRRNEARKLNHAEVVEEDKRNKLPANWEARKRKIDWELADEEARRAAEEAGEDYEQLKRLDTSAAELERRDKKKKKKNPDMGFSGFADAQFRQYQRLTRQFEPDLEMYEKQKQEMGEDFFPGVDHVNYGGSGKVSQKGLDRMVEDLEKQIDKRAKYSRRRQFREDADVDYINERNRKFNLKAARYYDKYTAETKQNLERGTAV